MFSFSFNISALQSYVAKCFFLFWWKFGLWLILIIFWTATLKLKIHVNSLLFWTHLQPSCAHLLTVEIISAHKCFVTPSILNILYNSMYFYSKFSSYSALCCQKRLKCIPNEHLQKNPTKLVVPRGQINEWPPVVASNWHHTTCLLNMFSYLGALINSECPKDLVFWWAPSWPLIINKYIYLLTNMYLYIFTMKVVKPGTDCPVRLLSPWQYPKLDGTHSWASCYNWSSRGLEGRDSLQRRLQPQRSCDSMRKI